MSYSVVSKVTVQPIALSKNELLHMHISRIFPTF